MEATERLEDAIDGYAGRADLCGAIRISKGGAVLFESAYGRANEQLWVDNRLTTRFHIASATKMFIAAAVVRLVREGKISLQAHPSSYLPVLSALDPRISVQHLLTHMSGLGDVYDQPSLRIDMIRLAQGKGRLLDYLTGLPQAFEPGARWGYSSTGYLLLAYIVEQVVSLPFDVAASRMFLQPLGMDNTGADDPFQVNRGRATGQNGRRGVWRNTPNDRLAEVDGPREFYSTVSDLDRWGTAMLDGKVLDAEGLAMTFTPHADVGGWADFRPGTCYGFGWFLGSDHRFISGMTAGFRSAMWQFPAERLNVVMLWNNECVDSRSLFAAIRPSLMG